MNNEKFTDIRIRGTVKDSEIISYKVGTEQMKELVESGSVYKKCCGKNKDSSISILCLAPRSRIMMHEHTADCEWYMTLNGDIYKCPKGHSHALENISHTNWLVIISVKAK